MGCLSSPMGHVSLHFFRLCCNPSTKVLNHSSILFALQMTPRCPAQIGNVRLPAQTWRWLSASMREILLQVVTGSKAELSQVGEIIADGMTGSQRALHF